MRTCKVEQEYITNALCCLFFSLFVTIMHANDQDWLTSKIHNDYMYITKGHAWWTDNTNVWNKKAI